MRKAIQTLESMIQSNTTSKMTEHQKGYVVGLADAIEIIKEAISRNMITGNTYYVIMYHEGNVHLPYIEHMMLYKINQSKVKTSYCFSKVSNSYTRPDLVLASEKGVRQRVFLTKEQAEEAIK